MTSTASEDGTALAALPDDVRRAVVSAAAGVLPRLGSADVPAPLRRFVTTPPQKRAAAAAAPLAAALADGAFRVAVATALRKAGETPGDAAHAWLLRPDGWQDVVAAAVERALERDVRAAQDRDRDGAAREAAVLAVRLQASEEQVAGLRAELAGVRDQAAALRRQVSAGRPQALEQARAELLAAVKDRADALATAAGLQSRAEAAEASLAAQRALVTRLESDVESLRSAGRRERASDTARLRVLVDTLVAAGQGLRQELALPPVPSPGQLLEDAQPAAAPCLEGSRGLDAADPALLDALLAAPGLHLLVDGYNVTKTGWPSLTLEQQRDRLVGSLAALQVRTGAEVTVVFDGAARPVLGVVPRPPSNIRVVWSPVGVTADDVVLDYVAAEPPGRPVLVVSSDREVSDGAARRGARSVASSLLVARLART